MGAWKSVGNQYLEPVFACVPGEAVVEKIRLLSTHDLSEWRNGMDR